MLMGFLFGLIPKLSKEEVLSVFHNGSCPSLRGGTTKQSFLRLPYFEKLYLQLLTIILISLKNPHGQFPGLRGFPDGRCVPGSLKACNWQFPAVWPVQ